MAGFGFDLSEVCIDLPKDKRTYSCIQCKLHENCTMSKIQPSGNGNKGILVIGGFVPHAYETSGGDHQGTHYNFIKKHFKEQGLSLQDDCWYVPAIRCYVKEQEVGTKTMSACHSLLVQDIKRLNPKVIVTTSEIAWEILLYDRMGGRAQNASYMDWCGEIIPDQVYKTWILPIYNSDVYLADLEKQKERKKITPKYEPYFSRQIKTVKEYVSIPFVDYEYEGKCKIAQTEQNAMDMLDEINTWPKFAFDIETSGLSPYSEKQFIHSISFSDGNKSYAMRWYNNESFKDAIRIILHNDSIKIAHNMAFERIWMLVKLGIHVTGLVHDPMLAQHVFHNLKPTGLKYLVYARYGVLGYDEDTDEFLKPSRADTKQYGKNAINNIAQAPVKKILTYCAMDSLFTYWLARDIIKELDKKHQLPGYRLLREAEYALTMMHHTGFRIDESTLDILIPELTAKVEALFIKVMDNEFITRSWRGGKFSPSSDANVSYLLYTILKLPILVYTDKGAPSVDEEALLNLQYECPFVLDLIEYRKWAKILNTFILQAKREMHNGMIHPYFSINNIDSYRSGSSSPNLQNTPKRDKVALKTVRSLFFPLKGHKLAEYDYRGLEVCGSAGVTQDKNLVKFVNDMTLDMHRDMACILFKLKPEQVTKALRQETKGFVFAEFYGSYYALVAKSSWKSLNARGAEKMFGMNIMAHIKTFGIHSYEDWEEHCKNAEEHLWGVMFPDYKEWRKVTYQDFCDYGEIYYETGFTYKGPATRNSVLNAPAQGGSFHLNLWAITRIQEEIDRLELKSRLIGEIHDSMLWSIYPPEEAIVDKLVWKYGTQLVKKEFEFVSNINLMIEKSIGEVDSPWSEIKEVGYLGGY
jgi:DNA polymerase I-like protein with 3'-5' exonuclease and polymerase domains/uracil-DNA glycosylase